MKKKLSLMSLEELWQLFPIVLKKHDPCWEVWYKEEALMLHDLLVQAKRISHIGSTAVPSIWAKPIIDILVEVESENDFSVVKEHLIQAGYRCMSQDEKRISFNKGYTEEGFAEKVFHLHLRLLSDHDELYFRDYLLKNPECAREYEELKLKLWKQFEHHRDHYTEAKTDFIKKATLEAKRQFGCCYEWGEGNNEDN